VKSSSVEIVAAPAYSRNANPKREEPTREASVDGLESVAFDRSQCDVDVTWDLRDAIVDYLRPTLDLGGKAARKKPDDIPIDKRKAALLVNNSYPGPALEATEGDLICITVMNNFKSDPVSIHWHGQHVKGYPAFDGVWCHTGRRRSGYFVHLSLQRKRGHSLVSCTHASIAGGQRA